MRQLLIVFIIIFFTSVLLHKLIRAKNCWAGNFQINNNFSSPLVYGVDNYFMEADKTFSISITPQLLVFFKDNKALGLQTGYHHHNAKIGPGRFQSNGFDIGVFFKQYRFFTKA
jgi:hypothetical protein